MDRKKLRSVNFQEKPLDKRLCRLQEHKEYASYLLELLDNFKEEKTPSNIALVYVENNNGQRFVKRMGRNIW